MYVLPPAQYHILWFQSFQIAHLGIKHSKKELWQDISDCNQKKKMFKILYCLLLSFLKSGLGWVGCKTRMGGRKSCGWNVKWNCKKKELCPEHLISCMITTLLCQPKASSFRCSLHIVFFMVLSKLQKRWYEWCSLKGEGSLTAVMQPQLNMLSPKQTLEKQNGIKWFESWIATMIFHKNFILHCKILI